MPRPNQHFQLKVSTHSHPKVAGISSKYPTPHECVSTHSHPKVAGRQVDRICREQTVSTHSHPKVAGRPNKYSGSTHPCFNTQPPEGGWKGRLKRPIMRFCFNTQPPEGGWQSQSWLPRLHRSVSTHSHPKVAGRRNTSACRTAARFQHTATRRWLVLGFVTAVAEIPVSTHSHPKVAGRPACNIWHWHWFQHTATRRWLASSIADTDFLSSSFNTQPPEGGWGTRLGAVSVSRGFQHTATRRWLVFPCEQGRSEALVSTHSHPKVAGLPAFWQVCFCLFQHTATRRWLGNRLAIFV